jgi:hypothetical protein
MKTVVVLAMPRSGSSLLSGVLHRLGVWMGTNWDMGKQKNLNKFGCYENTDFVALSTLILARAGSAGIWYDVPKKEKIRAAAKHFEPFIKRLIRKHNRVINKKRIRKKGFSVWGWKDPGAIYVMPFVHPFLEDPYYIVMRRNVDKIADSQIKVNTDVGNWWPSFRANFPLFHPRMLVKLFFRWGKMFFTKGDFMTDRMRIKGIIYDGYERIDGFVKGKKVLKLKLDGLIKRPRTTIKKIIKFLGITPSQQQLDDALRFVHPELVHF